MGFFKKRKKTEKEIKKVLGQQIRYLRRNLSSIEKMLDELEGNGRRVSWTAAQWRHNCFIKELFCNQTKYKEITRQLEKDF